MFHSRGIFVVLFLALSQLCAAGTSHVNRHEGASLSRRTNAARMAAGLPPLPPRALQARTGKGGDDHDHDHDHSDGPSKPQDHPASPKPSGKPADCDDKKQVRIKCYKKDGHGDIGYISKNYSTKDHNKRGLSLCGSRDDALEIDFENSVTPFDVKIRGRSDFDFLGFSGNNLGAGESAILTATKKTNIHNAPSNVGNAFSSWSANSESQIWRYTRESKKVSAEWVNTGGIHVGSTICYSPDDDVFHLVTDLGAFKRNHPQAYEVELEIED